jgi:hypothetical protein
MKKKPSKEAVVVDSERIYNFRAAIDDSINWQNIGSPQQGPPPAAYSEMEIDLGLAPSDNRRAIVASPLPSTEVVATPGDGIQHLSQRRELSSRELCDIFPFAAIADSIYRPDHRSPEITFTTDDDAWKAEEAGSC